MRNVIGLLYIVLFAQSIKTSDRTNHPVPRTNQSQSFDDKKRHEITDQRLFMLFSAMLANTRKIVENSGSVDTSEYMQSLVDAFLTISYDVCKNTNPAQARARLFTALMKEIHRGNKKVWIAALYPS